MKKHIGTNAMGGIPPATNETSTAVVPATPTGIAATIDYGQDAGAGFENQTQADISIPFLKVLQGLSPEVTKYNAAKPGMLFNTVTEEVSSSVTFVPATTRHVYVEWKPRSEGGGFIAEHQVNSPVVTKAQGESQKFGEYFVGKNELVETFYVYGMLLDENGDPSGPAILGFTSTKIGPYKKWNTRINMFQIKTADGRKVRPPLFAHSVKLTTEIEHRAKGDSFNVVLNPAKGDVAASLLPPGHPALEAAKSLRDMVQSGGARAAYETAGGSDNEVPAGAAPDWNK